MGLFKKIGKWFKKGFRKVLRFTGKAIAWIVRGIGTLAKYAIVKAAPYIATGLLAWYAPKILVWAGGKALSWAWPRFASGARAAMRAVSSFAEGSVALLPPG